MRRLPYEGFIAAAPTGAGGFLDWMAQLPSDKREETLARIAKALNLGPCSLIRVDGPKDDPLLNGLFIVLHHLLGDMLRITRKDVTIEVLASVADELAARHNA
jgi:hypothetical protein